MKPSRISTWRQLTTTEPLLFFFFKMFKSTEVYVRLCSLDSWQRDIYRFDWRRGQCSVGCHHGTIPCKSINHQNQTFINNQRAERDRSRFNLLREVLLSLHFKWEQILPKSNDIKVARVQSSQHHGQVVGLGAAVGQVHHLREASACVTTTSAPARQGIRRFPTYFQGIWQVGSQLLTILVERRVDIDVRSVPQSLQLPLCGRRRSPVVPNTHMCSQSEHPGLRTLTAAQLRTLRVTVAHADRGHTGKQIQVSFPVHVPQPLHVTLVDEYRVLVVGHFHGHGEAIPLSDLQHSLFGHSLDKDDTRDEKRQPPRWKEGWTDWFLPWILLV